MTNRIQGAVDFLTKTSSCSMPMWFRNAKNSYVAFAVENPETITQVEKAVKALSFALEFIPQDYDNSIFLTEILNSGNSLFTFINDKILGKLILGSQDSNLRSLLERWLTVVECTQALLEMSVSRLCGSGAKWAVIVLVSLLKATLRLVLLYWFKSGIQMHPAGKPLVREALFDGTQHFKAEGHEYGLPFSIGRRTGRVIRKLDHSPPVHSRTWKSHSPCPPCALEDVSVFTQIDQVGETLYIIRPLVHLVGIGFFGTQSIVPWLASLVTDASSCAILSSRLDQGPKRSMLTNSERCEIQRRVFVLLFYLLRSPMYDRFTKPRANLGPFGNLYEITHRLRVLRLIQALSDYVPLVHFVLHPLARYLPKWQQVYFYAWKE